MFYVYHYYGAYIKVTKTLKLRKVFDISEASYWNSKKQALTWSKYVQAKHPNFSLCEAELKLK